MTPAGGKLTEEEETLYHVWRLGGCAFCGDLNGREGRVYTHDACWQKWRDDSFRPQNTELWQRCRAEVDRRVEQGEGI